ncbi:MAG TPA: dolichyl-phosphate beta-glucosyltransferase [Geomonas sp.]|nr:dolichyl-phosphate beta-glucosyltransferase [Geomonas sp.]
MWSIPADVIAAVAADNLLALLSVIILLVVVSLLLEQSPWRWLLTAQDAETARAEAGGRDAAFQSELRHLRFHLERSQCERVAARREGGVDLSVVIPAYNERDRIITTILATIAWCQAYCPSFEIVVTDDGSTDETLEICRIFSEYHENFTTLANPHLGKGAAVRAGMLHASGRQVLFMDADGATPVKEIEKLRAKLAEGCPVAIGSRSRRDDGETVVERRWHRKIIGRIFAAIVQFFGVSGIDDTQCGFKMFRGEVVKAIFSRQRLNGFAFDVEVLLLARKLSLQIAEVPIDWSSKQGSKVNLVSDTLCMLADVLKVKIIHRNTSPQFQADSAEIPDVLDS